MTKNCIIFDIDGTLANLDHRLHFIKDGNRDWTSFFDAMGNDTPVEPIRALALMMCAVRQYMQDVAEANAIEHEDAIRFNNAPAIFLCSGRPDSHRRQTERWLEDHMTPLFDEAEAVLMRPAGDYRPDVEIKREMLRHIRGQGYEPLFVVDDRQRVVDMWRSEGVTCLQCADSAWDKERAPKTKPGDLYMMIGPSGAGKSNYVEKHFIPEFRVSSDDIRAQLCDGDFRDQSKNAAVFAALHALVKTRITHGLDTVVDATNLRDRDRRAIRDLVPADCDIYYIVIDRPLEEKQRDAGWRANIRVGDMSLIEKHHQTFQSNLRNILAGDGDPRVHVQDLRKG